MVAAGAGHEQVVTTFGYTLMGEQSGPRELVRDAVLAEQAGFSFSVASDHYFPWLDEQGHSPYAWSVLGAVAQATDHMELMTYVTCPIGRYHPAVVAQKAATVQILSDGRFTLGLGSGERLNEHVVGGGWPAAATRHQRLEEAIDVIAALLAGGYVTHRGHHYQVDSAKVWDLPERPVPIALAVSGPRSCRLAGSKADVMIGVAPDPELGQMFDAAGGTGKPRVAQLAVCWDPDREAAVERAHREFRWSGSGWAVNAELPGPAAFAAATTCVRPEDVAGWIPCGPEVAVFVDAVRPFVEAGYTHVAVVQVGGDSQPAFIEWAGSELLSALDGL